MHGTVETTLAFVNIPPLLCDLVAEQLERRTDVRVRRDALNPEDLAREVAAAHVGVLVAGRPQAIGHLLEANPRIKIVVLLDGGRRAAIHELRPVVELAELSVETLVCAVEASRRAI